MRLPLVLAALVCSGVLGTEVRAAPPAPAPDPSAALRDVVRRARDNGFTGVILVSREGKLLLKEAVGEADRRKHVPLTADTRFRLASLTKQMTALLVMQEVEKGTLSLDAPASTYLPTLSSSAGAVTLRQLLLHTSGLPNPSDLPADADPNGVPSFYTRVTPADAEAQTQAAGFCSGPSKRPAGERFEYNNCDYLVLGAVLERVTQRSYAQLVQERIARKLRSSTLGLFPAEPARQPVTARGYLEDGAEEPFQNPATYGAAGGLFGTAKDVLAWDTALLSHQLLSREATERMFTPAPGLYGEALGSWSYELSVPEGPRVRLVERQGDIGGTRLLNLVSFERRLAVVILANTERAPLFNTYSREGLGYELVAAASR